MRTFLLLLQKDLRYEARVKETLVALFSLSLIAVVVVALALSSARLDLAVTARLYPGLLWVVFVLSTSAAIGRTFEFELRHDAVEGLLLLGVSPVAMYLAKVVSMALYATVAQLAVIVLFAVLCDVPLLPQIGALGVCTLLVSIGYAAVATLTVPMTAAFRARALFLPVILLPLLFPLLLAAIELSQEVMQTGSLNYESLWLSMLLGLDVMYIALGINLYEFVLRD